MCQEFSASYNDHACVATVEDCAAYGGARHCPASTTSSQTPSVSPSPTSVPLCVWDAPSEEEDMLTCADGTTCSVRSDPPWRCCAMHGGRLKCPVNYPTMCSMYYGPSSVEHLCATNCSSLGGPLACACLTPSRDVFALWNAVVVDEVSLSRATFDVKVACADGFEGTVDATPCDGTRPDQPYHISGDCQPQPNRTVTYGGFVYATIDGADPGSTNYGEPNNGCTRDYVPLPAGWEVSPYAADARWNVVIHNHETSAWATMCLVFANGDAYRTSDGGDCGGNDLQQSGNSYRVSTCPHRVLIRRAV